MEKASSHVVSEGWGAERSGNVVPRKDSRPVEQSLNTKKEEVEND